MVLVCFVVLLFKKRAFLSDCIVCFFFFFFQAEDGIRVLVRSRGLGDVYKRQQLRRVCTETRLHDLWPDIHAYEQVYTQLYQTFPVQGRLWGDADVFQIDDIPVVCWRTTKTTINSINYFTDGTFSEDYFIIEGYQRAHP